MNDTMLLQSSLTPLATALAAPLAKPLATPLWHVPQGQAVSLAATRSARWLRLREGRLWVTAQGRSDAAPPEDWWLSAGESLRVPPGTPVLAEGWPSASFEVLEEPRG